MDSLHNLDHGLDVDSQLPSSPDWVFNDEETGEEESEDEILIGRFRASALSGQIPDQPTTLTASSTILKSKSTRAFSSNRGKGTTVLAPLTPMGPSNKVKKVSVVSALSEFVQVAREQLQFTQQESRRRHDLAIKERDLAIWEKELLLQHKQHEENERAREHERKMMDLKLALVRELKTCTLKGSVPTESGDSVKLFQGLDILPSGSLGEVLGSPERLTPSPRP